MTSFRLLLDEDVWPGLAEALRQKGVDAISVHEIQRQGINDWEQMQFAITHERVLLTHNIRDFVPIARLFAEQNQPHPGIIVAAHFDKGTLIRRTIDLLTSLSPEQIANTVRFI